MPLTDPILNWLQQHIGAIDKSTKLAGSTSTTLYHITAKDRQTYVLRLYDNEEWLAIEPDLCEHEAGALQAVASAQVNTPHLVAYEPDANIAGLPLLLMTCLEGDVWLQPDDMDDWLRQSAEALTTIHRLDAPDFAWTFYRYTPAETLKIPTWSPYTQKWQHIINILQADIPPTPQVFIHRDYHMTNFLWKDKQLTGVVDWINACVGYAGMDVGHMRYNLAKLYGYETANKFLSAYQQANPNFSYHPFWDLVAIGDTCLYDETAPSIYPPWLDFGITGLSNQLMIERTEAYTQHLLQQF